MTEPNQIERVCEWNGRLARENLQLREAVRWLRQRCQALDAANADLAAQLAACDAMLGVAMDCVLAER